MNNGERIFLVAKWISIIGLLPILYIFFGTLLFMVVGNFLNELTNGAIVKLLNEQSMIIWYIIAIIGFIIFSYCIVQKERKKNNQPLKQINYKFMIGVFLIFIGHLGLGGFYALMIYGIMNGGGSISGIFFIPMIFWMILFYLIGFGIVNNQKYLERLREKNQCESHT